MRPGPGVLDTSVVILLDQLAADADLPEEPLITTVTLAELSVGPLVTDDESERAVRLARLQVTEATFEPIPFDVPAARAFGHVPQPNCGAAVAVRRPVPSMRSSRQQPCRETCRYSQPTRKTSPESRGST